MRRPGLIPWGCPMTAVPLRTVEQIDLELRNLVKAKANDRSNIQKLSGRIVEATRQIDRLLAERSQLTNSCPPTAEELVTT